MPTKHSEPAYADDFIGPQEPMLEVNIPFVGFYNSKFGDIFDREFEQLVEDEDEKQRGREGDKEDHYPKHLWIDAPEIFNIAMRCSNARIGERLICRDYVQELNQVMFDEVEIALGLRFSEMTSPREYNFETDKVYAHIPLRVARELLEKVSCGTLREMIRERHSSRSGFISFYSNDYEEWEAKPIEEWDTNELGTLLRACISEWLDEDYDCTIYYRVSEYSYTYFDAGFDFAKFRQLMDETREDLREDYRIEQELIRQEQAEWESERGLNRFEHAPRCDETLDMFGGDK